jgi:hypothetical protein
MKFYKTKPSIEILDETENGDIFKLRRSMTYCIGEKSITVPKGFESDGASVPRFLWWLISPNIDKRTLAAAILHDYLYRIQPEGWTRKQADAVFYGICRSDGLQLDQSILAWLGLRLFGGKAWRTKGGVI